MRGSEHRLDGALHYDPRLQDRKCEANYRGRSTVPLRTARQKGQESCADHGKAGCEHDTEVGM